MKVNRFPQGVSPWLFHFFRVSFPAPWRCIPLSKWVRNLQLICIYIYIILIYRIYSHWYWIIWLLYMAYQTTDPLRGARPSRLAAGQWHARPRGCLVRAHGAHSARHGRLPSGPCLPAGRMEVVGDDGRKGEFVMANDDSYVDVYIYI